MASTGWRNSIPVLVQYSFKFILHPRLLSLRFTDKVVCLWVIANVSWYLVTQVHRYKGNATVQRQMGACDRRCKYKGYTRHTSTSRCKGTMLQGYVSVPAQLAFDTTDGHM